MLGNVACNYATIRIGFFSSKIPSEDRISPTNSPVSFLISSCVFIYLLLKKNSLKANLVAWRPSFIHCRRPFTFTETVSSNFIRPIQTKLGADHRSIVELCLKIVSRDPDSQSTRLTYK